MKTISFTILISAFFSISHAQSKIIASLNFDPKINGFGFSNYRNIGDKWKDDVGTDDMIRMFGVNAVCKNRDANKCVMHADARSWLERQLKAMDIGHCEGIAVASLRMQSSLPFKKKTSPENFQNNARAAYNLSLLQPLENYIAYFWITQTFDEVSVPSRKLAEKGPLEILKVLIDSFNKKSDTFLLSFWKHDNRGNYDGHAVTPFAIEENGTNYRILVYDNNYPSQTRYLIVNKNAAQDWSYSAEPTQNFQKPDYVGNLRSQTLQATATSWREGKCFDPSFAEDEDKGGGGCGMIAKLEKSPFMNASLLRPSDADGEDAEFFLTGEGDMLVIDGNGDRIGYDPRDDTFYEEPENANAQLLVGGFGIDAPHYTVPYEETGKPYTIIFSGRHLTRESTMDFVFSAPGFTVGFDNIQLDPNETLTAVISDNGEQISFTASADGETPKVFYSFDPDDNSKASYLTEIGGVALSAKKTLSYEFDLDNGKLYFSDNDGNEDQYDIELIRLNANGTEQVYEQNDLDVGKTDKYEMDFGSWKGSGDMCFKDDNEGDGFDDEICTEEPNEDDGINQN